MSAIPEVEAASRIASLLDKHQNPRWLTPACLQYVSSKVVGHRHAVAAIFDELDADPKRIPEREFRLQQQAVAAFDDRDFFLEQAAYHLAGYRDACAVLSKMGVPQDLYDADFRGEREDDRRISQERRDENAIANAPKGIAS